MGDSGIAGFLAALKLTRRSVLSIPEQYTFKSQKIALDRVGNCFIHGLYLSHSPA